MAGERIVSPVVDLMRQHQLLQQEYEHEKQFFEEQTRKAGVPRRVRQGLCWFPLRLGRAGYNSLNQAVVEVSRAENDETEHLFEYGRPVCFFRMKDDGQLIYSRFQGTVSYVQDNRMLVVVPSMEAAAELQSWVADVGVQLYFDGTSYQTMFAALKEVMAARAGRLARLREVVLGTERPEWRKLPAMQLAWLNPSQEKAVNKVLCAKDVAVVHGPPGTGKTTTLVEAIYETLRRETQVLVCAQSNTAVDWIAEKLVDRGVNVLRVGNPTRVNEKMMSFTYEKRFEQHPSYPRLCVLRKSIREEAARLKSLRGAKKEAARVHLHRLRQQAVDLEVEIDARLFDEARVVACTLVGSANRLLTGKRFSTLFIDEAGQALEAACWIAIARSDRVILAGDHLQLPPTVKCHEAARGGLDRTLLQRIQQKMPETVSMLTTQYRMHEDIMRFPSRWFYHGKLQAAPEVGHRNILEFDTPVTWVDTAALELTETQVAENFGRLNKPEAELLVAQLREYIERIGAGRIVEESIDFGLISPYRAQVQYIRQLIKRDRFFAPTRRLITIHTVDGFQGQERDVILISLVRANEAGDIGFLNDLRRMNVAMTRARMKLIILGDASTLARHAFYKALYEYISRQGKVVVIPPDAIQTPKPQD